MNWDDYRNKIDLTILEIWGKILRECNRNGFIFNEIKAINGVQKITWNQVMVQSGGETYEAGEVSIGSYEAPKIVEFKDNSIPF